MTATSTGSGFIPSDQTFTVHPTAGRSSSPGAKPSPSAAAARWKWWCDTPATGRCCRTSWRRRRTIRTCRTARSCRSSGSRTRRETSSGCWTASTGRGTGASSWRAWRITWHPRSTASTPTPGATSATPWREKSPCARGRNPRGCPWRAGTRPTTGPAPSRSMSCRACTTHPKAWSPAPTTASPTPATPTTSPTCSSPPTASSASATCSPATPASAWRTWPGSSSTPGRFRPSGC